MTRERLLTIAMASGLIALAIVVWKQRREMNTLRTRPVEPSRVVEPGTRATTGSVVSTGGVIAAATDAGFGEGTARDIEAHGSAPVGLVGVVVATDGGVTADLPSDRVIEPLDGGVAAQELTLRESFGAGSVPWGSVVYDANRERPWTVTQFPREYRTFALLTKDDDGRVVAYTRMRIGALGEAVELTPSEATYVVEDPPAKWRLAWMPSVGVGIGGRRDATLEWGPSISVFAFSHGALRDWPTWLVLGGGLGHTVVQRDFALVLTPAAWSLRGALPWSHSYASASVLLDPQGVAFTLGISTLL
jgi:hypothetical protein